MADGEGDGKAPPEITAQDDVAEGKERAPEELAELGGGVGVGTEEGDGGGDGPPPGLAGDSKEHEHAAGGAGGGGDVEVTFVIHPDGFTHPLVFDVSTVVSDVKATLGHDLRVPPEHLVARLGGVMLSNSQTLADVGLAPGSVGVAVDVEIDPTQRGGDYTMPPTIEVTVYDDVGEPTGRILVDVEKDLDRKLYLGGYRHKKTGAEYHHAGAQTLFERRSKWEGRAERFTRETQTVDLRTRSLQTVRETATQMARRDLYIDDSRDKVVVPRPYFSSKQLADLKLQKTLVLQCHWRGYCARKLAWQLRDAASKKAEDAARAEGDRAAAEEEKHAAEIQRRMHPRSTEDFEILYNELENWRAHETRRIEEAGLPERERLEALAQLLHKETKLLQTIDRLKIGATKENRERRIARMLKLMSEPKKWEMSDGETAQVHTPFSTRAKELQELYSGLNLPMLTVDERLDVLLHVKWTVKEFDCLLTREIVDLIDREADLLNRGRSEKSLEGLRRRVSNLFLQFIETPEFNPEAARFQKVPRDLSTRPSVRPVTDSMIRLGKTG